MDKEVEDYILEVAEFYGISYELAFYMCTTPIFKKCYEIVDNEAV